MLRLILYRVCYDIANYCLHIRLRCADASFEEYEIGLLRLRADVNEDHPVSDIECGKRQRKQTARVSVDAARQRHQTVDFRLVDVEFGCAVGDCSVR